MKGQGARGTVKPGFEGGQTPLAPPHARRRKGFNNPFRVEYHVVNLDTLETFDAGAEVDPDALRARGLVAKRGLVKVLGRGELTKALTVQAHAFSAAAEQAIEAAGGTRREPPAAVRRPPPARQGQRPHQPLDRRRPRLRPEEVALAMLSRLRNMFRVARPAQQDPLHDL